MESRVVSIEVNDKKKAGVAGSATMEHGVALNFAFCGYQVILSDIDSIVQEIGSYFYADC